MDAAAAATSTLPTPPSGLDRSESALGTGPDGELSIKLAPPRFAPGDAIFFSVNGHPPSVRGVVSGGPFPPEGLGHTYALSLADSQAVRAFEVQLAPDLAEGSVVTLGPPPPGPEGGPPPKDAPPAGEGVVEELVDPAAWRPAYRVKMAGAKKAVVVSDTRLASWARGGSDGSASAPPPSTSSPPPFAAPHAPPPPSAPAASAAAASPAPMPSLAAMTEAQKLAKSAASSIAFEDVPTAVRYLQESLRLLTVAGAGVNKK